MPSPFSQKDLNEFTKWGVPLPKHADHLNEDQMEAMVEKQKTNEHAWVQRGNDVYCQSCPHRHGGYCLPNQLLSGTDEATGMPVFKTITY